MLKKLFVSLILMLAMLIMAFFLMNLIEEPLSEEVSRILYKPMKIPTMSYVSAYKFALGFHAPLAESPQKLGDQVYEEIVKGSSHLLETLEKKISALSVENHYRCKVVGNCSVEEKKQIEEFLSREKLNMDVLVKRYEQLLNFGGLAQDVDLAIHPGEFRPVSLYYMAGNWFYQIQKNWERGAKRKAIEMAMTQRRFYENSLEYNNSVLFYVISLRVIRDTQKMLNAKIQENEGTFKSLFGHRPKEVLSMSLPFTALKKQVVESELMYSVNSLRMITRVGDVFPGLTEGKASILSYIMNWQSQFALDIIMDRNATVNAYYKMISAVSSEQCLKNHESCQQDVYTSSSFWEYMKNPIGHKISQILVTNIGSTILKMKVLTEEINTIF